MAKRLVLHNSKLKIGEYYFVKRWTKHPEYNWRTIEIQTIGRILKATKNKIPSRWYARGFKFEWRIEFQDLTKDGKLSVVKKEESYSSFYPFTFKRALELLPKFKPKDKAQRAFLRAALKGIASEVQS